MWHDISTLNRITRALFGVLILCVLNAGYKWVARQPMFELRVVKVQGANEGPLRYVDAATVRSAALPRIRGNFFTADLAAVRARVTIPILRKDFMVDEYQFFEARAYGADAVLLIVAALSKSQLRDFYDVATELGMASLIEVHTADELERALEISPQIVGVNSRNLKTLEVSQEAFADLIPRIPSSLVRVAESGIASRADVEFAQNAGANAILVGEALVTSGDPKLAMRTLLGQG